LQAKSIQIEVSRKSFSKPGTVPYFVLTIHASLNAARLDEIDDMLLDFIKGPPEGITHTFKLDGGKWLEVEDYCTVSYGIHQFIDMREEVDIQMMSCLASW